VTEQEWLTATDYLAMLIYLRGDVEPSPDGIQPGLHCGAGCLAVGEGRRVSSRKLRLFAAAICKKWGMVPLDAVSSQFQTGYERFFKDASSWDEVIETGSSVQEAVNKDDSPAIDQQVTPCGVATLGNSLAWAVASHVAKDSVAVTCKDGTDEDRFEWGFGGLPDPLWQATRKEVKEEYPPILREIVGNPFTLVTVDLACLTATVIALAQAIYEDRGFDRMPILADALEDSGCTNADILNHCRGPGPHSRGCWVVDLLLGKD
jgi:hypothetical protein